MKIVKAKKVVKRAYVKKSPVSRKGVTTPLIPKGLWAFAGHIDTVGGKYADFWEAKVDGQLKEGDVLRLVRESNNVHDKYAIAVYTDDMSRRVGYVPRESYLLAGIMDIGVVVGGRVVVVLGSGVKMRIYIGIPKK